MATMKLTQRAVEKITAPHPSGRQALVWDSEIKGFGLLVSGKTNAKTYVVQSRLKDGRSRRVTVGPASVLDCIDAREQAKKTIAQFYSGDDPKALAQRRRDRALTLRAALDRYLDARKDLAAKSRSFYKAMVERHLASWLDKPLREIDGDIIEARHAAIKAEVDRGPSQKGTIKTTGGATANGVFRAFRAIYNFAAERDPDLPPNPVRRLKRGWYSVGRRERLVPLEKLPAFHAALAALPSRTASDYLRLLLFTGLRRGEAAALRWCEVDFADQAIRLSAGRTKAKRKLDLPMSSYVRDLLVARRAIGVEGEYVFPADSKSGHIEEPKFHLAQVAKATGIEVSAHDLRRTFVTVAEGSNISVMALKTLVNHSLGSDVTSGYVIMTIDRLREPAQVVADRLEDLCGVGQAEGAAPLRGKRL